MINLDVGSFYHDNTKIFKLNIQFYITTVFSIIWKKNFGFKFVSSKSSFWQLGIDKICILKQCEHRSWSLSCAIPPLSGMFQLPVRCVYCVWGGKSWRGGSWTCNINITTLWIWITESLLITLLIWIVICLS